MLVRYRSEFLFSCACFSSEISSVFVIADVRPKIAISSFFLILRVDRRIWETTRVFSLMSRRELWHLHVIGQIMLLSLVTSHELSISIPLAGRLTLFGGGLSLWSSMRSSRLVWARRVEFSGRFCWRPVFPPPFCPLPSRVEEESRGRHLPPPRGCPYHFEAFPTELLLLWVCGCTVGLTWV